MRVSAVVLVVMVLVHFAIMHIFTPTEEVNFAFVVRALLDSILARLRPHLALPGGACTE